jgi:hypothetical protein
MKGYVAIIAKVTKQPVMNLAGHFTERPHIALAGRVLVVIPNIGIIAKFKK